MKFKARCEHTSQGMAINKWMLIPFPESNRQPEALWGNTLKDRGGEILEGKNYKVIIEPDDEA